jgi:hypothetical protein
MVHDNNYDGDDEFLEYPADPKTQLAKEILLKEFSENPDKVYYQRQLEVWYEKQFFHWVTDRAIRELHEEEKVIVDYYPIKVGEKKDKLKLITSKGNRYYRRRAKKLIRLVEEYSDPDITKDVGLFGQELFKVAYARFGYKLIGEDTKEHKGKRWEKSGKNLDFIVEKKGVCLGCEVKNKLGYMDKAEMIEKMEICEFLGIVPIFIMRKSPSVWNDEIFRKGGFVQIFDAQIFPPGRRKLVKKLREELGLPVVTSEKIPNSIMERVDKALEARLFKTL